MEDRPRASPVDYESLAVSLTALAYPLRLALLDALEHPLTLSEIRVRPLRGDAGSADRAAAMPTVAAHLEKLVETGLVTTGETRIHGKASTTYAVNPQRLYALTEELRRLSVKHSGRGRGGDETGTLGGAAPPRGVEGPRLVLVHGVHEGRAYPLAADAARDGVWDIGRRRDATVPLDYDPYVSLENSVVSVRDGAFHVTDVAGSKNGTSVNWRHLPRGGSAALRHGDIVGVGRSLLVFYAD